jgi:DNA-binding NtrC family response regulator
MSVAGPTLVGKRDGKPPTAGSRAELRQMVLRELGRARRRVAKAVGSADALRKLRESDFGALLLDPRIENPDAAELADTIHARDPQLHVVVLDAKQKADEPSCRLCDGLPRDEAEFESPVGRAAMAVWGSSPAAGDASAAQAGGIGSLPGLIGSSGKMQEINRLARLVAPRDTPVLVVGGAGTGKELVARGIHELSGRSEEPFVVVNCAAIPESLLEAELVGFMRGSFTGASASRPGRTHAAHGGTLFLDEVGELPLNLQSKLLRFVQEREVERFGSSDFLRVGTRLISSTSADLLQRVRDQQFREDLYFRLAVFPLELPLLRDRAEDILPLAQHFLNIFCSQAGIAPKRFDTDSSNMLQKYSWPRNVRELQQRIERAFVLAGANEEIRAEHLDIPSDTK